MDPRVTDSRIRLVRNDTGPQIQLTLLDDVTGDPINLAGATATLHFRPAGGPGALFSRPLVIPGTTAAAGIALVVWEEGDLDQPEGVYEGEIEVLLQNGVRQTVFEPLQFRLREDYA